MRKEFLEYNYLKSFSHIRILVSDIFEAFDFYVTVLGWRIIMMPTTVKKNTDPIGQMCVDILGESWSSFKVAHLATSDQVGIALFQFEEEEKPEHIKAQTYYFSIQIPDLEYLTEQIKAKGGKQLTQIRSYNSKQESSRMVCCEDPYGNIIEIYSHDYALAYFLKPQPELYK